MGRKKKKQVYVVVRGHRPGLYTHWFGEGGAAEQVEGFTKAVHRGFYTCQEATRWLASQDAALLESLPEELLELLAQAEADAGETVSEEALLAAGKVLIYTDGGALDNPGPAGYGVVLRYKEHRKELSGGFRLSTNSRMELLACVVGLRALKGPCEVVLYSDSKYVVNGITQGWAKKWRANGWMRDKTHKAENVDLWEPLLDLCERHDVTFVWVRGHAGHPENERCDQLATQAAQGKDLPPDTAYEAGTTQEGTLPLFSA